MYDLGDVVMVKKFKKLFKSEFNCKFIVEEVIYGILFCGKMVLVMGCNLGFGFEMMCVLIMWGVYVIGVVWDEKKVKDVCDMMVGEIMFVVCEFFDFDSVVVCVD